MRAIIKTGGKQYLVSEGEMIYVEKLDGTDGDKVVFDEVLMLDTKIGNPGKQKKIKVFKYKSKNRSNRRKLGHRQPYTKVEITKLG